MNPSIGSTHHVRAFGAERSAEVLVAAPSSTKVRWLVDGEPRERWIPRRFVFRAVAKGDVLEARRGFPYYCLTPGHVHDDETARDDCALRRTS